MWNIPKLPHSSLFSFTFLLKLSSFMSIGGLYGRPWALPPPHLGGWLKVVANPVFNLGWASGAQLRGPSTRLKKKKNYSVKWFYLRTLARAGPALVSGIKFKPLGNFPFILDWGGVCILWWVVRELLRYCQDKPRWKEANSSTGKPKKLPAYGRARPGGLDHT
jgi:hypothetical protein